MFWVIYCGSETLDDLWVEYLSDMRNTGG